MFIQKEEINNIKNGLRGWPRDENILAIDYFPSESEADALYKLIYKDKKINEHNFKLLISNKTRSSNFHNFIIGDTLNNFDYYKAETEIFITELQEEISKLKTILHKICFTPEEIEIFLLFVSKTSSLLFNMGFTDAITHAAQVTQKCIVEAFKRNSFNYEILQSAMVGWIHDPKVPIKYSWSNLATHPIIACSIANIVLKEKDIYEKLDQYLHKQCSINTNDFIEGVSEALAINNDSEYVFKNAILYRPKWVPSPIEPAGVIDQLNSLSTEDLKTIGINNLTDNLVSIFENEVMDWFENSAQDKKITKFSKDIETTLQEIKLETGIKGIYKNIFNHSLSLISNEHNINTETDFFNQLINGEITDTNLISNLHKTICNFNKNNETVFISPAVQGNSLFCSHLEVKHAKTAALSLEISDPLLLSPHKLLAEGLEGTALEQIKEFLNSFEKNIKYLPKNAIAGGKIWQRDLYYSILNSADELSNKNRVNEFLSKYHNLDALHKPFFPNASNKVDLNVIDQQIIELIELITDPQSWINEITKENYGKLNIKSSENKTTISILFNTLKKNYDLATETSPEMFGILKI